MERMWHFSFRSVLLRLSCLLVAFTIILSSTSIDAKAYTKAVKGTPTTQSFKYSFSKTGLDENSWNTLLPGYYNYDFEFDDESKIDKLIADNLHDLTWEQIYLDDLEATHDNSYERRDRTYAYGYYVAEMKNLFTSSHDAYAYTVNISISNVSMSSEQVKWARYVIGTYSDILNGTAQVSGSVKSVSNLYKSIQTDYLRDSIYIGVLVSYWNRLDSVEFDYDGTTDDYKNEWKFDASIDFSCDMDVTITPFYLDEGSGNITGELEQQTEELEDINTELNSQTDELEDVNTELNTQTEELENQTEEMKDINSELDEQTKTQKSLLNKVTDFFGSFFDNLVESIIGVFVPSKAEMSELFDRLMEFFNDTFGFLFYPFDFIIRLVDLFLNSTNSDTSVTFPAFSIMGMQVWDSIEVDLTQYKVTRDLFNYVRLVTGSIIAFGFIDYIRKFFDKRFGGGGS